MSKPERKKPTKMASVKVSAPQRSSTAQGQRSKERTDDVQVDVLVRDLGKMIEAARQQIAGTANAMLTTLYWQIGCRVRTEVLERRRAQYGARIVAAVGRQLEARHGRGFGEKNLRRMIQTFLLGKSWKNVSGARSKPRGTGSCWGRI